MAVAAVGAGSQAVELQGLSDTRNSNVRHAEVSSMDRLILAVSQQEASPGGR